MRKYLVTLLLFGLIGIAAGQDQSILLKLEKKYNIDRTDANQKKLYNSRINGFVNKRVRPNLTNTYVVEYNFRDGVFTRNRLAARVNHPMVFRIININRLAYSINISSVDSVLAYSMLIDDISKWLPTTSATQSDVAISQSANQTSTSTISDSDKAKDTVSDSDLEEANNAQKLELERVKLNAIADTIKAQQSYLDRQEAKKDELEIAIESLTLQLSGITNDSSKASELPKLTKDSADNVKKLNKTQDIIQSVKKELDKTKQRFAAQTEELTKIENINNKALKKFSEDSKNYITAYNTLIESYHAIRQLMVDYKEMLAIAQDPHLTLETYSSSSCDKMDNAYFRLGSAFQAIENFNDQLDQMQPLYAQLKSNPDLDQVLNFGGKIKLYAYVETLKANVDRLQKGFDLKNLEAIAYEMKEYIPMLSNEENYYVVSDPIQPKNDMVQFNISIKKRDNNQRKLMTERFFKHEEYIKKGIRLDLGLGLAGSIFPNAKNYELVQRDSGAFIARKGKVTYVPSVIGMATLGFRSANYTMFGLSAGMGLDVNDGQIQLSNFYTGPSLTLGRYDRVTIAGGVALKNLEVLKSGYQQDIKYPSSTTSDEVFTKRYHIGYFLSLTYNLTKAMKNNVKYLKYIP